MVYALDGMTETARSAGSRDSHRGGARRGVRQALPSLSRDERAGQGALRARRLGRRAAGGERADPLLRRARAGVRRAASRRPRGRGARRRHLAAGEAALHRPARRPQAAGARRDVLQLRHHPDPASHLRAQRLHLRARRGLDRVHRVGSAHLPQLLPGRDGPGGDPSPPVRRLRLAATVRRPRSRRRPRRPGPARARGRDVAGAGAEPSDPGAELRLLPQQGGPRRRQGGGRPPGDPVRRPRAPRRRRPPRARHDPARRGLDQHRLLALARLLHGRHGRALGLRAVPADADAREAAVGALHGCSAWRSRARRCSTATSSTTCITPRTSSSRRPAPRGSSCTCSTCRPTPTCSRSSRTSSARRRTSTARP